MEESNVAAAGTGGARRRALILLLLVVIAAAAGWAWWWNEHLRWVESTDNAYVGANIVQVTPQAAGTIAQVAVSDTEFVKAGQLLVRFDAADARIALDEAEAALAQAVREARLLYASSGALEAAVAHREAELARAEDDLRRRENLITRGVITRETLEHARSDAASARAQLNAAREQLVANRVMTEGVAIEAQPAVRRAAARVREAQVALSRIEIRAPVSGYVARRTAQVGQRVAAGAPLMAIVGLDEVWVDANFKEAQLERLRVGQPVELAADLYGRDVTFRGRIAGLSPGTGSAFALLPPQNASGNWVKVTQRVPVRIALDTAQLKANPLQVGLSMRATVDVRDVAGARLATPVASTAPASSSPAVDPVSAAAEARVREIISQHAGKRPVGTDPRTAAAPEPRAAIVETPRPASR